MNTHEKNQDLIFKVTEKFHIKIKKIRCVILIFLDVVFVVYAQLEIHVGQHAAHDQLHATLSCRDLLEQSQAHLRARVRLHKTTGDSFTQRNELAQEGIFPGRVQLAIRAQFDPVEQATRLDGSLVWQRLAQTTYLPSNSSHHRNNKVKRL